MKVIPVLLLLVAGAWGGLYLFGGYGSFDATKQGLEKKAKIKPGMTHVEVFDITGRRVASASVVAGAAGPEARFEPSVTRRWRAGLYLVRASGRADAAMRFVVLP